MTPNAECFDQKLRQLWRDFDQLERVLRDEAMASHTTFRVGGPADFFFEPQTVQEIAQIITVARSCDLPVTILGNGSNVIVADAGIRGLVISLGDPFSDIRRSGNYLHVKAGSLLSRVASIAAIEGLGGLAFASGIPGTIGGAVMMNAGAYDHCIADVITKTSYLDTDLIEKEIIGLDHAFSYRHSCFKATERIITETVVKLTPQPSAEIYAEMAELAAKRRASQPLDYPSAGSAFKRPAGYFAGKLISDSGLKGFGIGGAEVSAKHAGFIINRGRASASDVAKVFFHVRQTVLEHFGVRLEPEVRFIGDWSGWQEHEVIPWKS